MNGLTGLLPAAEGEIGSRPRFGRTEWVDCRRDTLDVRREAISGGSSISTSSSRLANVRYNRSAWLDPRLGSSIADLRIRDKKNQDDAASIMDGYTCNGRRVNMAWKVSLYSPV